ncbi:glycolate oxidase [Desulfosalsimonas propionicica]|uniref:D-lactate dehydrogenase (cytochrome) n=1 Tax=Desulfosalsimonas propionicica TaxID=332175 RepID=A0A7W0HJS1_9BACT|nr:FAD-binding oxidoreductase [Desulfosalsimonas propionicica]MBA2880534.1 glycolate oxidase [Desulfosalsimonas propionicica]
MDSVYRALADIVGEDYVSEQTEELFTYSKDLGTSEPRWPEYVAAPKTADEVSRIVEMANEQKLAVVPLGGGMSLAGLALALRGGITLDLKRMDQILELNEQGRYMVVEAGVSHGKVTSYLHKNAPHLMHSEPGAPPAATIGGNLAIHGQGDLAHPYGFNSDMINGLEVVLPTGEICRMGSCALGNQWYTLRPLPDLSLFMGWSGCTGIITKVSLRLFPCKKIQEQDVFVVENENLVPEILFKLTHVGMAEDLVVVSQEIPPPFNRLHYILINLAGDSREELEFKRQLIFDQNLAKYIQEGTGGIGAAGQDIERPVVSKTSDWRKGGGFEYVGAIVPVGFYPEGFRLGVEISARHEIPYTVLGRVVGCGHSMMFSWTYAFNRADNDTVSHARQALHETDERVLEMGGTLWKPAVFGQKLVMDRMDANTREMMKKVKTLLDPNGIMNPGNWEVA